MSIHLKKAIGREDSAASEVVRIMERDYPVGSQIEWDRGGLHVGIVQSHSRGSRIKVCNDKTGREVWITAYHIR